MVPFWVSIRCRIVIGIQKGTIILTTTHMCKSIYRGFSFYWLLSGHVLFLAAGSSCGGHEVRDCSSLPHMRHSLNLLK